MSTSFEVYPRINRIVKIRELIELSNKRINEFLRKFGLEYFKSDLEAFMVYKHDREMAVD